MNLSLIKFFFLLIFFSFCNQPKEKVNNQITNKESVYMNQKFVHFEQELIKSYINKNHLELKETGSGIYYKIEGNGNGSYPQKGQIVSFLFNIYLLNDVLIYSSDTMGPYGFVVDKDDVPRGLNEVIKMLKIGEKANFILPSHLAYGVHGDGDKIPSKSSLYYEIELIDFK